MAIAATIRIPTGQALDLLDRYGEGFLLDAHEWHPGLVNAFPAKDELELTSKRCKATEYTRVYFEQNISVPIACYPTQKPEFGTDQGKGDTSHFYQLLPRGYDQQARKIAGIRKPHKLVLDVRG